MTDCSQLQALLDGTKQERQALDDPETYCQDQCDPGDIICIKHCLRSIRERIQATDQEIAKIENDMGLCTLFGGAWKITVDGTLEGGGHFEGTIDFTGPLSGTITIPQEAPFPSTPFIGLYFADTQRIELLRSLNLDPPSFGSGNAEDYTGTVDFSTQLPTMDGKMELTGISDLRQYHWSAQKQS